MIHDFSHAKEFAFLGGRLFVVPTKTKDVVTVEGSVRGGPNQYREKNRMLPLLAVELLDAGTGKHTKNVLREALAERGISLSFGAGGDRTLFSGQCFPEDLSFLLSLIAECLGDARFPEAEVTSAKTRELGKIAEEKSDTNTQAHIALSRMLFDPSHVNYEQTLETLEKEIRTVRRADLLSFRKCFGMNGLILAVTGEVSVDTVRQSAEKAFRKFEKAGVPALAKKRNTKPPTSGKKEIFINDKANVDVYLGASIPLMKSDPAYLPLSVVSEMLGGRGFNSHLMQTIRERDGLTYGVRSSLSGLADGADGAFTVWATFSPDRYQESVEKLREEIGIFFATGITADTLKQKQEEIAGSYLVSLSTTQGLARALHQIGADGRPLSYLTEYPDLIQAVTLVEARRGADLIPLDKLSLAAAGTFPKKK